MSYNSSCKKQWAKYYYELLQHVLKWEYCYKSIWHGDGFTNGGFETDEHDICSCSYTRKC